AIDDQGVFLDRFFSIFNTIRNGVFLVALFAGIAALLLISVTIQVSAFTRRTEVGIMRLVGATRWYTQLPFLLEAVVAGVVGAVVAIVGVILFKVLLWDKAFGELVTAGILPGVDAFDIVSVSFILLPIAIVISALTGYVTL